MASQEFYVDFTLSSTGAAGTSGDPFSAADLVSWAATYVPDDNGGINDSVIIYCSGLYQDPVSADLDIVFSFSWASDWPITFMAWNSGEPWGSSTTGGINIEAITIDLTLNVRDYVGPKMKAYATYVNLFAPYINGEGNLDIGFTTGESAVYGGTGVCTLVFQSPSAKLYDCLFTLPASGAGFSVPDSSFVSDLANCYFTNASTDNIVYNRFDETYSALSTLTQSEACTFGFTLTDTLPALSEATAADKALFTAADFGITVETKARWASIGYDVGPFGDTRTGIGFFYFYVAPPVPYTDKITFTPAGIVTYDLPLPEYGYEAVLNMALEITKRADGSYGTWDNGIAYDSRSGKASWFMGYTDTENLIKMFRDDGITSRAKSAEILLPPVSGWFPALADKGSVGTFQIRPVKIDQGGTSPDRFRMFRTTIAYVVETVPLYTIPDEQTEGPVRIDSLTGFRFSDSFSDIKVEFALSSTITRSGIAYMVDKSSGGDGYEASLHFVLNSANAARLINHLYTNVRGGTFNLYAVNDAWIFGSDKPTTGVYYRCKLISPEIRVTVPMHNRHEFDVDVYMEAVV